jgi:2-amino-4-hydroxy-6-hydroxymethyldihydropteridine diphosphokinase
MTEQSKSRAFLGLGGNLGSPLEHFRQARQQLAEHRKIELLSSSPVYQTPPLGGPEGQPDYLNAVLEIQTSLSAQNLLHLCRQVEDAAGRVREIHWGPRTLDIDLLIFAELVTDDPLLTLPHPRLHLRHFVLQPLYDLNPQLQHPGLNRTIQELLTQLPPAEGITQFQKTW